MINFPFFLLISKLLVVYTTKVNSAFNLACADWLAQR